MPHELSPRHLLRHLLGLALLIGIVAAAISAVPGLGTLRARFASVDPLLLVAIAALKLCSSLSNIVAFRDVFCGRMSWRFSYQLGMAEQATNVLVPTGGAGGLALGAWALRQGGMSGERIARRSVAFFVLTSIPNFACVAIFGVLLLTGVAGHVPAGPTIGFTVAAVAVALLAALLPGLIRHLTARDGGGAVRRHVLAGLRSVGDGISDTGALIAARRWRAVLGAIGYLAFDIAGMVVAFSAFGSVPPLPALIFAYTVGQLGGLIPLPGGIGGTDGGLIGATVLYGSSLTQATAAVLAYRLFQLGVPAILGTIAFIRLRLTLARSRAPAEQCAALAEADAWESRQREPVSASQEQSSELRGTGS